MFFAAAKVPLNLDALIFVKIIFVFLQSHDIINNPPTTLTPYIKISAFTKKKLQNNKQNKQLQ